MLKRIAIFVIALAVSPVFAPRSDAQSGLPPKAHRIEIDLSSGSRVGTIPADVQFEFVGNAPARAQRIRLLYRKCTDDCPTAGIVQRDEACDPILDKGGQWLPDPPVTWTRPVLADRAQASRFALPMFEPLEAGSRYAFLFDVRGKPDEEGAAAFKLSVQELAARPATEWTDAVELLPRVRELSPCAVNSAWGDAGTVLAEALAEIDERQQQRLLAVEQFDQAAARLEAQLDVLRESPLGVLVRQLRARAATRPHLAEYLERDPDLIAFLLMTRTELEAISQGVSPTTPQAGLERLTADSPVEAVEGRATQLLVTQEVLRSLTAWLAKLEQKGALDELRRTGALTAGDVSALRDLRMSVSPINQARGDVFRMINLARNFVSSTKLRDARIESLAGLEAFEIADIGAIAIYDAATPADEPPKSFSDALMALLWRNMFGRTIVVLIALGAGLLAIWKALPDNMTAYLLGRWFPKAKPADPEVIEVAPQKFAIEGKLSDSVAIDVIARRRDGSRAACVVELSAADANGNNVGFFRSVRMVLGESSQGTAIYTAGDTAYRGPVTIRAAAEGTRVAGTAVVHVIEPSRVT